jgi:hypothetical protein
MNSARTTIFCTLGCPLETSFGRSRRCLLHGLLDSVGRSRPVLNNGTIICLALTLDPPTKPIIRLSATRETGDQHEHYTRQLWQYPAMSTDALETLNRQSLSTHRISSSTIQLLNSMLLPQCRHFNWICSQSPARGQELSPAHAFKSHGSKTKP